jgi:metal-responsive CopG/Arc/MetJ family transcriptional regulator
MVISSIMPRVGRKRINHERILARFPKGTLARIDAVLKSETNEKQAEFIREAVERELKRREKKN